MKKKIAVISLGCPRNLVDSERLVSEFKRKGYAFSDEVLGADTVVVNTCAFIEDAKRESIDTILKVVDAKKSGDIKRIIIAGCLSQRYPEELKKEFSEVDEFRGVLGIQTPFADREPDKITPRHYSYLKISEGCKNRCTYCVIPYLKGPYKSRKMPDILKEADMLVKSQVKEIILVGQDTSLYGIDLYGKKRLKDLLKKIDKTAKDRWVRLLYCHPANIGYDILKTVRDSSNVCNYIDLPIEHISDKILRAMGRKTGKKEIIKLISLVRKTIPDVAIRTSLIVGFPGETKKDFKELKSFVSEMRFERLGLFRYSREEGTPAYGYKGHIREKEKDRRFDEIMSLQQDISRELNEKFIGRTMKVLVDEKEDDYYTARTEYDAPEVDGCVYVKGKNLKIGNFYPVKITDTYEYDLVAKLDTSGNT